MEKSDPRAAARLVERAKVDGKLTRVDARAKAAQAKQRPAAPKMREQNRTQIAKPGSAGPVPLAAEEALAIEVSIAPKSADAALFKASIEEHGAARLYPVGTARTLTRCWVQFGSSDRKKKGDENPRKAEFNCADLRLCRVTKYKLD